MSEAKRKIFENKYDKRTMEKLARIRFTIFIVHLQRKVKAWLLKNRKKLKARKVGFQARKRTGTLAPRRPLPYLSHRTSSRSSAKEKSSLKNSRVSSITSSMDEDSDNEFARDAGPVYGIERKNLPVFKSLGNDLMLKQSVNIKLDRSESTN